MIVSVAMFFLLINGLVVIPTMNISSPTAMLQNQLKQLPNSNQIEGVNQNYNILVLSTTYYIGNLPLLNLADVKSFEQYHNFADRVNAAIKILNNGNLDIHIKPLQGTLDEYDKISKTITKFSPGIKEYNAMIVAARNVRISDQQSINDFYSKSGIFAFVIFLTVSTAYAGPSYTLVGIVWRASGLTGMAVKCPACISFVLSEAHWFVRNSFVGATATILNIGLDVISKISIPSTFLQQAGQFIGKFNSSNWIPHIRR